RNEAPLSHSDGGRDGHHPRRGGLGRCRLLDLPATGSTVWCLENAKANPAQPLLRIQLHARGDVLRAWPLRPKVLRCVGPPRAVFPSFAGMPTPTPLSR